MQWTHRDAFYHFLNLKTNVVDTFLKKKFNDLLISLGLAISMQYGANFLPPKVMFEN